MLDQMDLVELCDSSMEFAKTEYDLKSSNDR